MGFWDKAEDHTWTCRTLWVASSVQVGGECGVPGASQPSSYPHCTLGAAPAQGTAIGEVAGAPGIAVAAAVAAAGPSALPVAVA